MQDIGLDEMDGDITVGVRWGIVLERDFRVV